MNDIRLNGILKRFKPLTNIFIGVFGKNELKATSYPFCLISNESNYGTKGTHWVALYFDVAGNCDYFDSYGQPPKKEIQDFMNKHAKSIQVNTKQFQSIDSDVCGQYCIYFLTKRALHHSMHEILSVFNENRHNENDVYVLDFIHNKFNC